MSVKIVKQKNWTVFREKHRQRIRNLLGSYLQKRERHEKDPVLDFLFEYYSFRPALLERWSPGPEILLEGEKALLFLKFKGFRKQATGVRADPALIPSRRLASLKWILQLMKSVSERKPFLGCYGMHEWAMVYKTDKRRHPDIPLRLTKKQIASFVETQPVLCTHFDAFRFFTDRARPLNQYHPEHNNRMQMDQPGCVHVTMDLYKWAYKLYPWIPSELIGDAFELAVEARTIDMQASPYDLEVFGLRPIPVETGSGRDQYRERQQYLYKKSDAVRSRLIRAYQIALEMHISRAN